MALIVQKFGGTSVANVAKIKAVARIIKDYVSSGDTVVAVVSAMAGVTNHLVSLCNEVSSLNTSDSLAEYDTALSTGEIVTSSLLALELQAIGVKARSVLAWQLPIETNDSYTKALVNQIDSALIEECIKNSITPVLAGFQGINQYNRYTTLGRGGSDTTAALIGARLGAARCDIFTDVDGVFTADPRVVCNAKKLNHIHLNEMLELASSGAKVLHPRCIEIAVRYGLPIRVLSTFEPNSSGTIISLDIMENRIVTGITFNKNVLKIMIKPFGANLSNVCRSLSDANVHIDMSIWESCELIVPLNDKPIAEKILDDLKRENKILEYSFDATIAVVSIVGYGLKNDAKILSKILAILDQNQMKVHFVQTSEIKILLLLQDHDTDKAVRVLHDGII